MEPNEAKEQLVKKILLDGDPKNDPLPPTRTREERTGGGVTSNLPLIEEDQEFLLGTNKSGDKNSLRDKKLLIAGRSPGARKARDGRSSLKHLIAGRGSKARTSKKSSSSTQTSNDGVRTSGSSFLSEKLAIAGRRSKTSASNKNTNIDEGGTSIDEGGTSILDEKLAIAGRSARSKKPGAGGAVSRGGSFSSSSSLGLLEQKHIMAGRQAATRKDRRSDERRSLLEEKLFIAGRSRARRNNDAVSTMPPGTPNNIRSYMSDSSIGDQTQNSSFPGAEAMESIESPEARMSLQEVGYHSSVSSSDGQTDIQSPGQAHHRDEEEGEVTLNATLVDETNIFDSSNVVGSATVIDTEAEEKANQRKRMKAMGASFVAASVIAVVVAVAVVFTRPGLPPPSFSPTISAVPSGTPSMVPSASPSTDLFGFSASNSFDQGVALATFNSPQSRALEWLIQQESALVSEMNYKLLQAYSLVTVFYATFGSRWNSTTTYFKIRRANGDSRPDLLAGEWLNLEPDINVLGLCSWRGVSCNQQNDITSLQLSNDLLLGSLPEELAMLNPSLTHLDLSNNSIIGDLLPTTFLSALTLLESLDLSSNITRATLPLGLGNLTRLTYLDMSDNGLLAGSIDPQAVGRLQGLRHLDLGANSIVGNLPTELGIMTNLTILDVNLH